MNLTDAILQNDLASVKNILRSKEIEASINDFDAYGFTPLIEAAIANHADIAEVLLQAGAKVNQTDLTGNTALHWAVENSNEKLCALLLAHKADPNAYSSYGQPVLVNAFLRQQENIKQLLYRYGADLEFAKDYINAKLIGHRFELVGKVYIKAPSKRFIEVDFEGFVLEFTLNIIRESLSAFRNNFAAHKLSKYFPHLEKIIQLFQLAIELIRYQQYSTPIAQYKARIDALLKTEFLLIPFGFEGHAITFIRYGNLFAKCDRGENSLKEPSIVIYQITNMAALTPEFLYSLFYEKHHKNFVEEEIPSRLGLKILTHLSLPSQISGNCSWANIEAAIPAILFFLFLSEQKFHVKNAMRYKVTALSIYKQWRSWDKQRAFHQSLDNFYQGTDPARKLSLVNILMTLLLAQCKLALPKDLGPTQELLQILTLPEYRTIFKNYLIIYTKQFQTNEGKNLLELLDLCGYDPSDYL